MTDRRTAIVTGSTSGIGHGVASNAICPGHALPPLVEKRIPGTATARGITGQAVARDAPLAARPTRRFVEVDRLGALAVLLRSDAAAQITGTAIPVDGGWTAH
ncbi:SDR family oxidoreductase [Rubrimonas cliftonensis]|uniref:3-hydroxybutyrate dehydrogenase n=1 Tax=Rubrimonas cliftonensis TaxID=89524 RepID=A0A1H4G353_9RHOB|nr:SDR family oxidoreductase [Rubrimonas cliftonensis]SEB03358.1 3-hydroxybutyrate dehydrogenase [Rubrimonas cliftonensis]